MSNNTEWINASEGVWFVDADFRDNFDQGIDPGNVGLGVSDCVIEGTIEEIRAFGIRIVNACDAYEEPGPDDEDDECADGCGLAVDHEPPCRVKPGGAVLSNESFETIGGPR